MPTPSPIIIPWGAWLSQILVAITPIVALLAIGVVTWGIKNIAAKLPPGLSSAIMEALQQKQVNEVIGHAVDYSFAAVEGALRGKTATLDVANAQVAAAADYVVKNAPVLAAKVGPTLEAKIVARLSAQGVIPKEANETALGRPLTMAPVAATKT